MVDNIRNYCVLSHSIFIAICDKNLGNFFTEANVIRQA